MQKADGDGLHSRPAQASFQARYFRGRRRLRDGSVEISPLPHSEAHRPRNDRRAQFGRKVVKLGAILPADVDHIFKASRGYKSGSRSFALEQSIGGDSGPVDHLGALACRRLRQPGQDYAGRRSRIRPQLECFNCPVIAADDEIGKGSAGVDSDAH